MILEYLQNIYFAVKFYFLVLVFTVWPAILIVFISYIFSRKKIKWYKKELFALLVPHIAWFLLSSSNLKGKSLSNLIELVYLSLGIGIINVTSIFIFRKRDKVKPIFDIIIAVFLAVIIYFIFPMLPE